MVEGLNYLSELLDDSPIGFLIVDEDTKIVMCNDFLFKLFETEPVDYIGEQFGNVFNCINVGQEGLLCGTSARCKSCNLRNSILHVLEGKTTIKDLPVTHEYYIGGKLCERKLSVSTKLIKDNGTLNSLITIQDITNIDYIEKSLEENKIKYKQLFDNMTQGFALHEIITDENGVPIDYKFLDVNREYERLTSLKKVDVVGKKITDIISASDNYTIPEYGNVALNGANIRLEKHYSLVDKYFDVFAYSPQKGQFATIISDITDRLVLENENVEFEAKLRHEYYHDTMTGLYKRSYIFDNLPDIDRPDNLPLSLVTADVNGLRSINESLGFEIGDQIIIWVSDAIKSIDGDFIAARLSGDDFLVILPRTDELDLAKFMIRFKAEIQKRLSEEFSDITISFGTYIKKDRNISFEQALNLADDDLVKNKLVSPGSIQNTPINMILHTLHEKNMREEMHSKRVSEICVAIGKGMGLTDEDLNKLRISGLVHDIGKIGVAESILNKPGKLTRKEFDLVKQHSAIGFRILSANRNTSELAFYVLSHHERLDGSGYPNGISGDDIPTFARILSIADAYDAMTEKRTYCNELSKEKAISELYKYSGTQFDADIVDVFIKEVLSKEDDFDNGSSIDLNI